uniref:Uncharacterized protein n=1 Tax=Romanomermis culicivorax TaxID=13658 RepID=A0A915L2V7_ROMCU
MRTNAKMREHQEPMAELTNRMNEARKSGDYLAMQMAQYEMMSFQKKHGVGMTGGLKTALPQ